MKGAIFMVPRPNLGGNSIFLCQDPLGRGVLPATPTLLDKVPITFTFNALHQLNWLY